MAVSRAKKVEQVEKLGAELKNVSSLIIATYSKLTVAQDYELRKTLRSSGAKYRVVKNTLAKLAAKGTAAEEALNDLSGVTSLAYTSGDPVALAKAISKYAKDNPEFTFKAGVVEGRVISIKEIQALATMPSKEEIYSKLLFLMSAPAQRLVTVMNAVGKDLAVVINQGVEKNKFKEALRPDVAAGDSPASGSTARAQQVLMAFENAGESPAATQCPDRDQERGLRGPGSRVVWHGETRTERTGNPACD